MVNWSAAAGTVQPTLTTLAESYSSANHDNFSWIQFNQPWQLELNHTAQPTLTTWAEYSSTNHDNLSWIIQLADSSANPDNLSWIIQLPDSSANHDNLSWIQFNQPWQLELNHTAQPTLTTWAEYSSTNPDHLTTEQYRNKPTITIIRIRNTTITDHSTTLWHDSVEKRATITPL